MEALSEGSANSNSFAGLAGMRDASLEEVLFPGKPWLPNFWAQGQQHQVPDSVTTWGCLEDQTMEPVSLSGLLASFRSFAGGFDFRLSEGTYLATNIADFGNRISVSSMVNLFSESG